MQLSPRLPDLGSFEILLAIAQTKSLGGAARELGLSQQAVSARLSSMEARIGVRLAVRSSRGSALTASGTVVAEWAARLLTVAHEVDAGLGSLRTKSRHRITVAASQTLAEQLMPQWLVSLSADAQRHGGTAPEVILTATTSDQAIAAVRAGCAELGFVEIPGAPAGLASWVVARDELVVVVRPDHRWARRSRSVDAVELAGTPLVTREPGSAIREALTVALSRVVGEGLQQAAPVLELTSAAAMRAAVLAGAGPAVMSRLAVGDDLAVGRLRPIPIPKLDLRRALRVVWAGGRTPPAGAARDLLSHIRSVSTR